LELLEGVRVLDLTRVLAGPICAMTLGDLGADVIKVERPDGGDETRGWGPPFDPRGESGYFLSVNRNKKSLRADLADPADRALVRKLIGGAHVVVDNFRPGTLERLGLDPAPLLDSQPALIWCSITGFGPASTRPGYDFVVQAEQGWMSITGEHSGPPIKTGVAFADVIAGKDAAIAVLGALAARGPLPSRRRRLVISLADSAMAALVNVAQNVLLTGGDAGRYGNAHPNLVPYQLFDASDREIVVAVGSDAQWSACAVAMGLDDLATDPKLSKNAGRVTDRARVVDRMATQLRMHPAAHWMTLLSQAGVPCGIVRSVKEALATVDASPIHGVAPSIPGSVRLPPPRLGEHDADIRWRGWEAFG
jgi:crotonobetainyl-CoA:carnitine CoA-transferase CaiB-like acyl-CoA transferase